ncbi:MAG: hypothetical protein A3A72_08905 [Deltaproteobacteria bacterium RIFCSPLOWO2_01_FULL_38_9]|nr:MAG: hypothetical protein A3A72_08905 [Deltaproteobacteria bacterium RIFCSPLOWO2_01_FULL_38_9]
MAMNSVISEIKKGKNFLVCSHVGPDGDAMASTLAMGLGLEQLKKKVTYYNHDPVPENLRFLPASKKVITELKETFNFDAVFVMDCGALERLGKKFAQFHGYKKIINVDHHASNDRYGDINYILSDAASSGEVVWKVLKKAGCKLTSDIATNLYCTLVTDTGSFRYSNTNEHTLKLASEMVAAGADPSTVSIHLFESQPYQAFQLLGRLLDRLKVSSDGRYSWSVIYQKDLKEVGTSYEVTEDFINYPRAIKGVEVAFLFKELPEGAYKISMRSKTHIDVPQICMAFGGGGHKKAAACIIKGSFDDVSQKIFEKVHAVLV